MHDHVRRALDSGVSLFPISFQPLAGVLVMPTIVHDDDRGGDGNEDRRRR